MKDNEGTSVQEAFSFHDGCREKGRTINPLKIVFFGCFLVPNQILEINEALHQLWKHPKDLRGNVLNWYNYGFSFNSLKITTPNNRFGPLFNVHLN